MQGAEQRPEITPEQAFGRRVKFVNEMEKAINKVDGTPGKKSRTRRKELDKSARELLVEVFAVKPTLPPKPQ